MNSPHSWHRAPPCSLRYHCQTPQTCLKDSRIVIFSWTFTDVFTFLRHYDMNFKSLTCFLQPSVFHQVHKKLPQPTYLLWSYRLKLTFISLQHYFLISCMVDYQPLLWIPGYFGYFDLTWLSIRTSKNSQQSYQTYVHKATNSMPTGLKILVLLNVFILGTKQNDC